LLLELFFCEVKIAACSLPYQFKSVADLFFGHDGLPFINFSLKFKGNPVLLAREGAFQDISKKEKALFSKCHIVVLTVKRIMRSL